MFDLIDHILLYLPIFYYPLHYSRLIYVTVVKSLQSNDETFKSWVLVYLDRDSHCPYLFTWGNHLPLYSFEHKAISPKYATLNIYQFCFLDGKNHFSLNFRAIENLIKLLAPLWTCFSNDPPICPNSYEKFTKIEIRSLV